MIFCVEGNVNVGKTTFINQYANENGLTILKETPFLNSLTPCERQAYYIDSEIQKKKKGRTSFVIMDRSILSVYLYTVISSEFSIKEKENIVKRIRQNIVEQKVLIPNKLFFVMCPYDLINKHHKRLRKGKKTQPILVDYDYYTKYTAFFANNFKKNKEEIVTAVDNRQILLFEDTDLFYDLQQTKIEPSSIILLDGAPAIGKTTIGRLQSKYCYIPEQSYKKYSLEDISHQINSIVKRINLLRNDSVLIDTSFLMGITHLFYSHERELRKEEKLNIIYGIMKKVPLFLYVTKVIYLYTNMEILEERKKNDQYKKRKHFQDNLKYLGKEINFYQKLNELMNDFSNIYLIEAMKAPQDLINEIEQKPDKAIFLVDLFYYIIKGIKRGEI